MTAVGCYWHTLRYLKPVQIWGRIWFRVYKPRPRLDLPPSVRKAEAEWQLCTRTQSMYGPAAFRFLNHEAAVSHPGDWNRRDLPLLWLYQLHYFDDLNARVSDKRRDWHRDLIARWVHENPPAGGVGWQPYPVSLRIVNWIKWQLSGQSLDTQVLHSLAVQVRWLQKRLERHLLGNHLWANAKALIFAGTFFEGNEADSWRQQGLDILDCEMQEQILADGGHFERSPMYHAIVFEDMLDLLQLAQRYPGVLPDAMVTRWRQCLGPMLRWLSLMSHPDGEIAFFNDAVIGGAPDLKALIDYADRIGLSQQLNHEQTLTLLDQSGYTRVTYDNAVLIADVGEIGPDYLPGHAHADTLSFELSLFAHRVIVNSGIDRYGSDPERVRQRGTAAHSTVEVEGQDSSEVWGGFRVARRARPYDLVVRLDTGSQFVGCSHDGYLRLPGKVIHRREWNMSKTSLKVKDYLEGKFENALARFYLHPAVEINQDDAHACTLSVQGHRIRCDVTGGLLSVVDAEYHPGFGKSIPNKCLLIELNDSKCETAFAWDN